MYDSLFQFLIELNLSLTLGFGLYWYLLRRQPTHQWNRLFLVFWPLLCIAIASLQLDYVVWQETPATSIDLLALEADYFAAAGMEVPVSNPKVPDIASPSFLHQLTIYWWQFYFAGIVVAFCLFAFRLKNLQKLIGMGLAQRNADFTLLEHPSYQQVFSFGRYIFKQKDLEIPEMVLAHELVHVRQRHSLDLLWMELLIILNWFNPLIYLYRKYLKETHEFIADRAVVQQYGLLEYARLLVAQASRQKVPILALSFAAFTKKRIIAMKTKAHNPWARLRYWVILPLFLILIGAFSIQKVEKSKMTHYDYESYRAQFDETMFTAYFDEIQVTGLVLDQKEQSSTLSYPIEMAAITKISSGFGPRIHPIFKERRLHRGIDLLAPLGTPVIAAALGEVIEVEEKSSGYGKKIIIQHAEGLSTLYAQLQSISVKEGDHVNKGIMIGTVGSSGSSTGPHLHFEVRKDDQAKDPMDYLPELEK